MDERRDVPRQRTLKGATIVFADGQFTFQCLVRNLTRDGASLEVASTDGIPNQFRLVFLDRSPPRRCKVASRSPTRIGVEFQTGE